jgi:hypothetical protein
MVEHLPSKNEVLNSNSSTAKKKKKEKRKERKDFPFSLKRTQP